MRHSGGSSTGRLLVAPRIKWSCDRKSLRGAKGDTGLRDL